jgi:hypothetical protein
MTPKEGTSTPLPKPTFIHVDHEGTVSFEWFVGDDKVSLYVPKDEPAEVIHTTLTSQTSVTNPVGAKLIELLELLVSR